MNRFTRGALGALVVMLALVSWTGSATAAPPAAPPSAKHVVTAANIALAPGTMRPTAAPVNAYAVNCTAYGVAPYLGTVQGVQVIFLPNDILYRGYTCEIGKASLRMQSDGNLVVYDETGKARWATSWSADVIGRGYRAEFQGFDGNFVEYNNTSSYTGALWASNTCCRTGARLAVQADGNVVVYDSGLRALWSTGTWH